MTLWNEAVENELPKNNCQDSNVRAGKALLGALLPRQILYWRLEMEGFEAWNRNIWEPPDALRIIQHKVD
jgi:hypothetical protein